MVGVFYPPVTRSIQLPFCPAQADLKFYLTTLFEANLLHHGFP
jgi:hypothetical protein